MRKVVCWVVSATDILDVGRAFCHSQGGENTFEHLIGGVVVASASAPAIDHTLVVCENLEMKVGGSGMKDCENEGLKAKALCPADVLVVRLPARAEYPRLPTSIEKDAYACC